MNAQPGQEDALVELPERLSDYALLDDQMGVGFVARPFDIASLLAEVEKQIGKTDAPVSKLSRLDGQYDTKSETHILADGK